MGLVMSITKETIANRVEIAVRFNRAVKELKSAKPKTIAPLFSPLLNYSDIRAGALHKKRLEP